jgi:hypothetical protein
MGVNWISNFFDFPPFEPPRCFRLHHPPSKCIRYDFFCFKMSPHTGSPTAQPFSNSALAQLSPFFKTAPNSALTQLSPRPTQPFLFPTQPYVFPTHHLPNSAFAQLSPLLTQPFPNSAFSQKNQKDTINSVLGDFLQSLSPNGGLRPPHPPSWSPPHRIFKRTELEKGWVGKGLSWGNIELSWEKEGLSWSRAELVEGWVGGTCEKMWKKGWVGRKLSWKRAELGGTPTYVPMLCPENLPTPKYCR